MRNIARSIAFDTFSLFLLTQLFSGVRVSGGLPSLLTSGIALSLISFFVKPILKIISFPLNLITLGAFSIVINAIIFLILTLVVKQITISPFRWSGISMGGFVIPSFAFNSILAYIVVAGVHWAIKRLLVWITSN